MIWDCINCGELQPATFLRAFTKAERVLEYPCLVSFRNSEKLLLRSEERGRVMSHINYSLASELLRGRGGYELDSGATSRRRTEHDEEERERAIFLLLAEASR